MEIITKAVIIHSLDDIEIFTIRVNHMSYLIIKKRLELELMKAINILKDLKIGGEINSIYIPKNKKIQKKLNELVSAKNIIKQSIIKIRDMFQ